MKETNQSDQLAQERGGTTFAPESHASRDDYNPAAPGAPTSHAGLRSMRIYSHSSLLFWWPVWVAGYIMAGHALWHFRLHQIESLSPYTQWVHPSNNPGVIFILTIFAIILITNFSVRGLASGMVILGATLVIVVLAWLGWWDEIFRWLGNLTIHLSMGAYFWFSTLLFITWVVTVFCLDRLSYWEVTPGQLTHKMLFGTGSKSYNAQGMGLEKHRDDIFRHWLLGLGSGDLKISTSGATHEEIDLPNVLFIGSKVAAIQRLIAEVPEGPDDT